MLVLDVFRRTDLDLADSRTQYTVDTLCIILLYIRIFFFVN